MFCPKCGAQNAENVKFCRSCGIELEAVSAALTGRIPQNLIDDSCGGKVKKIKNAADLFQEGIRQVAIGVAFLLITIILVLTDTAGGRAWGFWMLIPAFTMIGKGVAAFYQSKQIEKERAERNSFAAAQSSLNQGAANHSLPPQSVRPPFFSDYSQPARATGELFTPPSSVTEGTTRHLDINAEGETMNLPRQK